MKLSMKRLIAKNAHRVLAAVVCGGVFTLVGCRIPNLRAPEAGPPLPADFNGTATPESSAQMRVEEFFTDPVLQKLLAEAVANNLELKMLREDISIAEYEVLARRGAYLPQVGVRANAGLERTSRFTREGAVEDQLTAAPDGRRFPVPLPDFLIGADVSWQVDIWRQLRNARDAAGLRVLATAEGRNFVTTRLVAEIADNYYALMALDKRLETLDQIIVSQENSQKVAQSLKDAGKATELPVQRFQAEVRRNQSERLLVKQEMIERENRINFLAGRFPRPVERATTTTFLDLELPAVSVGVPAALLANRPDIRQAEREVAAAGLEVQVVRADFFPRLDITAGVGYRAFHPRYFFDPEAVIANLAGGLTAPLINRAAIKAAYSTANARQLQAVYDYQRTVLNAFTEVITRIAAADNYRNSLDIKRGQLKALETSVEVAEKLFQAARAEYSEVLFAQRDLLTARIEAINVKQQQLSAVVYAYQALGGGGVAPEPAVVVSPASTVVVPPPVVPPVGPGVPPGGPAVPPAAPPKAQLPTALPPIPATAKK